MLKTTTKTSYYQRINTVLDYIQKYLYDDLTLEELSEVSCFSSYHFHRIFTSIVGDSVSGYIRRLRLQAAANALVYENQSISDIAFDAKFESQAAFNKAFKQLFNMTPSQMRKQKGLENFANPYIGAITNIEEIKMKVEIQKLPPQKVLFIRKTGSYFDSAPAAWKAMHEHLQANNIDCSKSRLLGMTYDDPATTNEDKIRFDACVADLDNPTAEGEVGVKTLEGGHYAVFTHVGPYPTLGETYRKIFGQWLPNSGKELRDEPTVIHYVNREKDWFNAENTREDNAECRIYIPVEA